MPSFEVIDIRDAPLAPGMRLLLFPDGMWSVLPAGSSSPGISSTGPGRCSRCTRGKWLAYGEFMLQKTVQQEAITMSRVWAMPSPETFSIPPITDFISRWKVGRSVDPFARDSALADVTNDLNPKTAAQYHMEAAAFCELLAERGRCSTP